MIILYLQLATIGCSHNKEIPIGDNDDLNSAKVPVMHIASSIVSEQKEKERRQLNIILHRLAESSKENAGDRKSGDIKEVNSLFEGY